MKVLLALLGVGLLIYAVIDCSRTPDHEVPPSLSRAGWLLAIILLPFLGPVIWLVGSRAEPSPGSAPGPEPVRRQPTRRPPQGPDDDPDFLRGL